MHLFRQEGAYHVRVDDTQKVTKSSDMAPSKLEGTRKKGIVKAVSWIQFCDQLIKFWLGKQKAGRWCIIIVLRGAEGNPLAIHKEYRSASYIEFRGWAAVACEYNSATFWEQVYGFEEVVP